MRAFHTTVYVTFLIKRFDSRCTGSPLLTYFSNNTVFKTTRFILVHTLICPFSTKSLLRLHGFLLKQLFFQSLKKLRKQRSPCYISNVCFKKTWTAHSTDTVLQFVQVFLKQPLNCLLKTPSLLIICKNSILE